jgi:ABC-type phosphate transport system substrate-binding protein
MKGDGKMNGGASRRQRIALACAALVAGSMCASGARAAQSVQDITAGLERFQLHGSGTTNPSKLIWYAMDLLEERTKPELKMTYRSIGSGYGKKDLAYVTGDANGYIDFASTDYGLDGTQGPTFLQIPFQIGAIGIFHTVPGYGSGELKISACTLAKIYTGVITMWNDDLIKADTGVTLPAEKIHVVFRDAGSSSTYGLQGYMKAACSASYPSGVVDGNPFALTGDQYHAAAGSDGVRREIASRAYSIGYLDAGHGHADDLAEFSLKNTAEEWLVTKEGNPAGITSANIPSVVTTAVQNAYKTAKLTGDLSTSTYDLFNKAGSGVWPICAFTYLHVRKTYTDGETAALVRAFVEFMLSDEIQAAVKKFYFYPLDSTFRDDVLAIALDATHGIKLLGTDSTPRTGVDWVFEDSIVSSSYDPSAANGVKTISKKRQAYVDYALELLNSTVTDLETSVAALEADSHEAPSLKPLTGLAAFDFVMAFAALIIGSIALHKARSNGRIGGGMSNYVVGP